MKSPVFTGLQKVICMKKNKRIYVEKPLTFYKKVAIMKKPSEGAPLLGKMQVSPSGMAAASQAASGEFDSRRLLQPSTLPLP